MFYAYSFLKTLLFKIDVDVFCCVINGKRFLSSWKNLLNVMGYSKCSAYPFNLPSGSSYSIYESHALGACFWWPVFDKVRQRFLLYSRYFGHKTWNAAIVPLIRLLTHLGPSAQFQWNNCGWHPVSMKASRFIVFTPKNVKPPKSPSECHLNSFLPKNSQKTRLLRQE